MTGDNVTKGYDLFEIRNIPTPHGSGKTPMYANMGKSTKPDPNRKITYPPVSYTHLTLPTILRV